MCIYVYYTCMHAHTITTNYSLYRQSEVARLREQLAAVSTIRHPPNENITQLPQLAAATENDDNIGRTSVASKHDTIPSSLHTHQSTPAPPTLQVLLVYCHNTFTATL